MAGFRQFGRIGTKLFSDQVFTVLADEIEQFIQPVNDSAFRDTGAVGNAFMVFLHSSVLQRLPGNRYGYAGPVLGFRILIRDHRS